MSRQNIDRDIEPQPSDEPMGGGPEAMTGLALLRKDFPAHQISKICKPYNKDSPKGKCRVCGGFHGLPAVALDYVGHAALTDRLLDADPRWNWEPVAVDQTGAPVVDKDGGMWIRLTICGVTRLGYGDAQGKSGANATKERIGDALRNAAMRFGAALDLWHKGDLHLDEEPDEKKPTPQNHKDSPQVPDGSLLDGDFFDWTPEDKSLFEDLIGEGKGFCKKVGLSPERITQWEARYRSQRAEGNDPARVFQRIGESIGNMQKVLQGD